MLTWAAAHLMQGQAADVESPTPMLEAHWETVHQHSSILFFKQAVLSMQVWLHACSTSVSHITLQVSAATVACLPL